jgi:hypothetical protein
MINLDDYLSTADELFNTNAQYWYFEFSGNNKPNTKKTFDVFVKALHEVYFFIQDNLNKPFGCIEKINNVSETNGFNEVEKLILVDKILGVLSHHPEYEKQQKVFIQLVDFRHDLSPYTDVPEIQNPNLHFDFEAIKTELATIEAPTEKHKFLMNLLFDYTAKAYEIDELEHEYYESMGFVQWIKTELSRSEYELEIKKLNEVLKLEAHTTAPKAKPRLGEYSNSQLVLIFYYFFKYSGIEPRVSTDIAPIAKFLHLITGKEFSNTQNSDFYKKLSKAPNHISDKSLIDDLNHIKPLFQKVELNEIVKMIDNEIDQCRTAIKETKTGKR